MTYVPVIDKAAGDPFVESMWDDYIMDNLNSGVMRPIADAVPLGPTGSIDFQSIPNTFAHLMFIAQCRADNVLAVPEIAIRINNITTNTYVFEYIRAVDSTVLTAPNSGANSIFEIYGCAGSGAPADAFGISVGFLSNYISGTSHRVMLAVSGVRPATSSGYRTAMTFGLSPQTTAINRLTFFIGASNFVVGTRITLYGMPK
jgi:hypothetical protein